MRIYLSHSDDRDYDFRENLYEPIKKSELAKDHQFIFPHDIEYGNNPRNMKEEIIRSTFIVAEVSRPSTSSGIELGWANEHGKEIYCLYRHGYDYSRHLLVLTRHIDQYSDSAEMIEKIANFIKSKPGLR